MICFGKHILQRLKKKSSPAQSSNFIIENGTNFLKIREKDFYFLIIMDFTYVGYFSSTWRKGHFTHVETSSWGQNVSCLHHSIIYEVLFRSVHNLELLQMKTNWTHFFQTLNTQMKKALLIKTNTLRVQSQTGKMKRFLREVLRGWCAHTSL